MNRSSFLRKRNIVAVIAIVASGIVFSSCLKNKGNGDSDVPAAGLMAFNLAPDQQSVAVRLSGNNFTQSPLAYTNYSGLYQRIYTGERSVDAYDYPNTDPLASQSFNFEQDKYYSLFVVGADGKYKNIITADAVDSTLEADKTKAFVRYINAIPDSVNTPTVTFTISGNNVVNEAAPYTHVGQFISVNPGDIAIAVKNSSSIDASRTINLQQGKVYTVLLSGIPGATDEEKKVQIKYIENGSVLND